MAYGVFQPKIAGVYDTDNGKHYTIHTTGDVLDAGEMAPGAGSDGNAPGRKYMRKRHLGLKQSGGTKRAKLVCSAYHFNNAVLGGTQAYGGLQWIITGKIGERTSE